MRPHGSPAELQRRRHSAIDLLEAGCTTSEVALRLGVDSRSVRRWRTAWLDLGMPGLRARPASGRPTKLNKRQREALRRRLIKGARANGFPTDLWTCPRVAELIDRCYGVSYHVDHLPRLLRSLGFSPQRPAKRAVERDDQRIADWVAHDWPRIKKRRAKKGASRLH